MPSQNKSGMRLPKAACLGYIMHRRTIALGLLTSQEVAMRAKQTRTSLTFPVLITELCRRAGVPRDPARDIKVTPSSATNIRHFKVEYIREEADRRKPALADTSPEIDIDLLFTDASTPTPVPGPSSTSIPLPPPSQDQGASSFGQPIRITHAMVLKMGLLAQSAEERATRRERSVSEMIESVIAIALVPLHASIDADFEGHSL